MNTTLLLNGRLHVPSSDAAGVWASRVSQDERWDAHAPTAMAVRGDTILWVGRDDEARSRFGGADVEAIDLDGAFVTPAFVDAHVHATSAGLLLSGLDLTACGSLQECLEAVRRFAAASDAPVLWGHGWDDSRWPQRRPPSRTELDDAVDGRPVYLSRIDVHSALVSSSLAARAVGKPGYSPEQPLAMEAHHVVRRAALAAMPASQRRAAQQAFLSFAASRGIGCVHECAGPDISGVDDLRDLLAQPGGPDVVGYWGELVSSAEQAREVLAGTGAHGLAGDLFADGALGSRTAALHAPYLDAPSSCGAAYLSAEQVADHVVACTEAGVQAGFHVIGDAGVTAVVTGFGLAARRAGAPALAARVHRLEHLEMVSAAQAAELAGYGVLASVQPQFDAFWGGTGGMYAQRLGAERALRMNPFAALVAAGMALAFGSDVPVTPADPWASVRAAVHHNTPGSGLTPHAALTAHTAGGHHAAGPKASTNAGTLATGAPASYAVWATDGLDAVIAGEDPRCLRTVVRGTVIFDSERTRSA